MINPPSYFTVIYVDEHRPVTAELEVVTGEIIKAIKGNPHLHDYFFEQLALRHSIEEKLAYARHFRRCMEYYRLWM